MLKILMLPKIVIKSEAENMDEANKIIVLTKTRIQSALKDIEGVEFNEMEVEIKES